VEHTGHGSPYEPPKSLLDKHLRSLRWGSIRLLSGGVVAHADSETTNGASPPRTPAQHQMTRKTSNPTPIAGTVTRWLLTLGLLTLVGVLTDRLVQVQRRLEDLEGNRLDEALVFQRNLFGVRSELTGIRVDLESSTAKAELTAMLSERLRDAESNLGRIGNEIEEQATSLTALEEGSREFGPHVLEEELERRDREIQTRLENRWQAINQLVSHVEEAAQASQLEVQRLEAAISTRRDLGEMWDELVGPVVQLAGDASVGSGVLLRSNRNADAGGWDTNLLTAWHVVRDIQGDLSNTDMPVPVFIYSDDGFVEEFAAELLAFDAELDAALLVIHTEEAFENGADLAPRERLDSIRIFDEVYAVGCPLGNDPIPTRGEVSTTSHLVDGERYWMINAPTYIGNSGGGIFDGETHELLGIFSKIYTHGTLRPTIVPHMGLVTPLDVVYDWLEEEGHGDVVPRDRSGDEGTTRVATASATPSAPGAASGSAAPIPDGQ